MHIPPTVVLQRGARWIRQPGNDARRSAAGLHCSQAKPVSLDRVVVGQRRHTRYAIISWRCAGRLPPRCARSIRRTRYSRRFGSPKLENVAVPRAGFRVLANYSDCFQLPLRPALFLSHIYFVRCVPTSSFGLGKIPYPLRQRTRYELRREAGCQDKSQLLGTHSTIYLQGTVYIYPRTTTPLSSRTSKKRPFERRDPRISIDVFVVRRNSSQEAGP